MTESLNLAHLVCAYLHDNKCKRCPKIVGTIYGDGELGCYGIADEIVSIVQRGGPFESVSANIRWRAKVAEGWR